MGKGTGGSGKGDQREGDPGWTSGMGKKQELENYMIATKSKICEISFEHFASYLQFAVKQVSSMIFTLHNGRRLTRQDLCMYLLRKGLLYCLRPLVCS